LVLTSVATSSFFFFSYVLCADHNGYFLHNQKLAVELATRFNGEIINADAMQMYRGLPVITNQLTPQEQRGIPHHLLGDVGLDEEPRTVTAFKREATRIVSEIRDRGKLPIVVGGTSYYLDALLFDERIIQAEKNDNDQSSQSTSTTPRYKPEELAAQHPILRDTAEAMLAKLREVDPVMADRWHPRDIRKIRNSLEIYYATGRRASDIYAEQQNRKKSKWASSSISNSNSSADQTTTTAPPPPPPPSPWTTLMLWLYAKPEVLNERLDKRVDKMVQNGLLDETGRVYEFLQRRLAAGETVDLTKGIWQSIGFKQFEAYHDAAKQQQQQPEKDLEKLKQTGIELTKTATRQYAKYQVRWVARKTIASLQEENLLDRFYLLDSTDISRWNDEVLAKGVELTRTFLGSGSSSSAASAPATSSPPSPPPNPLDISETAREVLTASVERCNRQAYTQLSKQQTCELCDKTFVSEETWQNHIKSNRHLKALRATKKRAANAAAFLEAKKQQKAQEKKRGDDVSSDEDDPGVAQRSKEAPSSGSEDPDRSS